MPCSEKTDMHAAIRNALLNIMFILLTALFSSTTLAAKGHIEIESFHLIKSDENLYINVQADIDLSTTMKQALEKGVDLYFVTRLLIMKPRWYWLDKEVARSKERIGLSYQALTRQYRLLQRGQSQSFPTLKDALQALGHQPDLLIKEHTPLLSDTSYTAILQIWLDVSRLSKPFQLEWLDTQDWNLSSEKKIWQVTFPLAPTTDNESDYR
ncbi:DUF4390 domain-containing protein [Nitrosomonas sp. HPC101]|uniref:DUF4390 domain-containing protein n=1 Tax=Nitrosomonas sp. HPC101 TaxID=1658667 RepID=UPI001F03DA87|nr:DUF4390 domain-containing protein [Nitrosomonas sp. HPC101]